MTRQNYYKSRITRKKKQIESDFIISLVDSERSQQPQLGCRKLLELIKPELFLAGVSIGRDQFFTLMSFYNKLIRRKRRSVSTTDSRHKFRVYKNQLKDKKITKPNQALVSDITYIRTDAGFVYLSLIMDLYSRKIVGYDCSDSLEVEGCLRSLDMAIKQLPSTSGVIHHSDRGSQYCCHRYIKKLKKHGLLVSMTEDNHCYENANAERLNGILKQEYGLGSCFRSKTQAYEAVRQAVLLYNNRRPHQALGYKIPSYVHQAA